ncbi:DHRS1 [Symbiodinium natans]|uniref:DHRS1 protein n=1 Tax=Symbiodinium natans TaxID=878477 RepID=A0A812T1C0_9DINO|nr:DHRS1 [Symbiodinium natans]
MPSSMALPLTYRPIAALPAMGQALSPGGCVALASGRAKVQRRLRTARCGGRKFPEMLRRSLLAAVVLVPGAARAKKAPDLRGRFAVVTGAGRGIGKGVAVGLGELGATVFTTGRSRKALDVTCDLVRRAGGTGVPILCDHGLRLGPVMTPRRALCSDDLLAICTL